MARRILDQYNPSVPHKGHSPFHDAADQVIDAIFSKLSRVKEKMSLELVCKRFGSRIIKRSNWKGHGENELYLGKDEVTIWINGYQFTFEIAHVALAKLLERIQVEHFILNDISQIWDFFLPALPDCSIIQSINLDCDHHCELGEALKFAQTCSTHFPDLTSLLFHCRINNLFAPFQFPAELGNMLCERLTQFGLKLNAWDISHRNFLKTIVNWFPFKLTELYIVSMSDGGFPSDTIVDLIGNIFAMYNNSRNELYNFVLRVRARNVGEVLLLLAHKTWFDNELVEIHGISGKWTCIKRNVNVKIELSLEAGQLFNHDESSDSESSESNESITDSDE